MDLGISGRTAVIAGGSRGLGLAAAKALAAEDVNVLICARDRDNSLARTRDQIAALYKGAVEAVKADVHEAKGRRRIFNRAAKAFGGVDILVVNTPGGVAGFKPVAETGKKDWHEALRCKFFTALELCQAVLPQMLERRWGRIINLSTVTALEPPEDFSLSNATRLASLGMFRTLAVETAGHGIAVNSVAVGHTETDALENYFIQLASKRGGSAAKIEREVVSLTPIRRLLTPEETGALVAFLCSELAGGITGQIFRVDGGFSRAL